MKKFRPLIYILIIIFGFCHFAMAQPLSKIADINIDLYIEESYRFDNLVRFKLCIKNRCEAEPYESAGGYHACSDRYNYGNFSARVQFKTGPGIKLSETYLPGTGSFGNLLDPVTQIFSYNNVKPCGFLAGDYEYLDITFSAEIIDEEHAWIEAEVIEIVERPYWITVEGSLDREMAARGELDLSDIDSQVNNGVDTDGDGIVVDDPDDEDDGDALDFSNPETLDFEASCECEDTPTLEPDPVVATDDGCLGPIDQRSSIAPNPEDDVNGIFNFDYRINANIEINADYDGVLRNRRYKTDFYVNSADGSAYFPKGFFVSNFGSDTWRGRKMHGSIWLSNGQLVSYIEDTRVGMEKKMAVTVDIDQTSTDVAGGQFAFINQFMNGIGTATSIPAPMPADLPWGDTEGFVSEIEQADGSTGKITIYFDREINMPPIYTNVPLVGFLVGVVKDNVNRNCNRLAVFTKMDTEGSSEYIQGELVSMRPEEIRFEKPDFKPTILGAGNVGAIASMTQEEQDNMISSQQDLNSRIQAKIAEIAACGTDDTCVATKTLEMQALVKQKQDAMYDLMTDTSGAAGSGSDLLSQQRSFRDELFTLNQTLVGKEQACEERLQEAYEACDRTRDDTRACNEAKGLVAECRAEIEAIKIEMKRLECEMAKLHGFEDSMEDCE